MFDVRMETTPPWPVEPALDFTPAVLEKEPGMEILQGLLEDPAVDEPVRWIWVTFQKEGIHQYPAALTDPKLKEVAFLGYPHRHIFHFKVSITVTHDDRDIEFILFKRELEALYAEGTLELNHKSCEMIAGDLHKYLASTYPGRSYKIEVSEDGENGCLLEWIK